MGICKSAGLPVMVLVIAVTGIRGQESAGNLARKRGVYVGAAVGGAFWGSDVRYKDTLKKEYNIIVAENAMKFDQLEPKRNLFTWKQADDLAAFAAQNDMALRGHNLVWHQASGWISQAAAGLDRIEMQGILKNHIDSVVGHFQGKILEWDVVNEGLDDASGGLRDTFWRQRIGDDYLDSAFTWAHRADPKALLFYNDYSGEGMGGKADRIYALVKGMKDRGVPVQGVGLQCHFASAKSFSVADIDLNMKRLGALGLRVSVTELDFRTALPADSAALAVQKDNYARLLAVCLANANCKSFLTWGFTDAYSWVPDFFPGQGAALPFDAEYKPKPAYQGMVQALTDAVGIRPALRPGPVRSQEVTLGFLRGSMEYSREGTPGSGTRAARNALGKWMEPR
ncbi:MAG: glycoside hydrolase family 10 [Fibrobacteres bacterium]|nr:glycoside hydrolase family 10 [Fibrobacterota bacterium]